MKLLMIRSHFLYVDDDGAHEGTSAIYNNADKNMSAQEMLNGHVFEIRKYINDFPPKEIRQRFQELLGKDLRTEDEEKEFLSLEQELDILDPLPWTEIVYYWEELPGTLIRVQRNNEKDDRMIVAIGHYTEDKWINFKEFYAPYNERFIKE